MDGWRKEGKEESEREERRLGRKEGRSRYNGKVARKAEVKDLKGNYKKKRKKLCTVHE